MRWLPRADASASTAGSISLLSWMALSRSPWDVTLRGSMERDFFPRKDSRGMAPCWKLVVRPKAEKAG